MKVSIITITYNSAPTVEATIQSVLNQDYKNLEYIIVDGISKDETLAIVKKYENHIDKIISENDKGLYDALNKGIAKATGEIIGILHSDDMLAETTIISDVVKEFEIHKDAKLLYGNLIFIDRFDETKIKRVWISGNYKEGSFVKGWMPPHPTLFVRRSLYEQFGNFKTELKYAADYELMLRFIHKHKQKIIYLNKVLVKMRMGGISNTNLLNKLKANKEDRLAWQLNGLKPAFFFMLRKPMRKLFQYLKR